tara:strand:- start:1415 stop:2071 length:657 start_codon:yes stop_codon:yes gene_type:complete
MKLITELNEEVKYVVEEVEGKKKNYFIEGVFMQGDIKNRNGRMYPKEVLAKEAARYNKEYIQKNKAYGELGHPQGPTINLERVSHMIKSLTPDGSNFIGKAKILDTPYGNIVKSLIDEGAQLGVSSRGMGTLKEKQGGAQEVQSDFMLSTAADIVADPSAPEAFVNGVMEGVEWVYNAASSSYSAMQVVDEIKKVGIKDAKKLEEHKIALFNKFMRNL